MVGLKSKTKTAAAPAVSKLSRLLTSLLRLLTFTEAIEVVAGMSVRLKMSGPVMAYLRGQLAAAKWNGF